MNESAVFLEMKCLATWSKPERQRPPWLGDNFTSDLWMFGFKEGANYCFHLISMLDCFLIYDIINLFEWS